MAAVAKYKKVGSTWDNEVVTIRATYDFTVDGGATGALDLFEATSDIVIVGFHAVVKTAVTATGSATVAVGVTGATDAFVTAVAGAKANLTLNAVLQASPVITEGTPNTAVFPLPRRLASGAKILQTIGTDALLTGKIEYVLRYVKA